MIMKNEIKEILNELESLFEISESPEHIINGFNKIKYYITNLQTIEQQYSAILSENAELKNKIFDLEDTLIDKKEYCYGLETQLTILQKENDRLNNIIDGYENMKKELLDYIYHNEYRRFGHIDGGEADEMREIINKTNKMEEGK